MTWDVWFLTPFTSMKRDISYWMYSSCTLLDIKFNQIHGTLHACMCIYTLLVHMHICVYIYMYHIMSRHIFKHFRLSFFNVLKAMNVCVQNTVFLRRIGYSFCFYSELGGHISKIGMGKSQEIPVNIQQDPLSMHRDPIPSSFLFSIPIRQVIPHRENRKLLFIKALGWFFFL